MQQVTGKTSYFVVFTSLSNSSVIFLKYCKLKMSRNDKNVSNLQKQATKKKALQINDAATIINQGVIPITAIMKVFY